MRSLALALVVTLSLALFGCPDKNASPDPAASAAKPATTGAASAGAAGSAKGGW